MSPMYRKKDDENEIEWKNTHVIINIDVEKLARRQYTPVKN